MNCHEPPCGMGREDSRPGTGHPGGHTGHPGGMPAGPRTLEDGSPLCRLIAWEVTRSCNLACKHCRAEAHPEPYPGELSTEEAKALIDTFPSVGNPIIIFTGGDPMIRPDVYELIAYAGSKGLRCVMSPNGTLITPENARKIKEAGVQRCSISIDGYNAEKHDAFRCVPGAFDATMRGIECLKAEGVEFRTNMDVGGIIAAEELLSSYDAVVLCCGAKQARDLNVPGRDANGVHFAVDYLTSVTRSLLDSKFADGKAIDAKGKNVLVIGGGDTGNDCQGTALRQGCTDLVALEMMPQPPKERAASNPWPEWPRVLKVDYGQTECLAKFNKDPRIYQTTVKEFLKDDAGNLTGAVISYLKPERDPETGRTRMVPTGEEFTYDCQLAFIAAGFTGCEGYVADAFGVDRTPRGNVADQNFKTNVDKVFVCGDMRRGQSLVVWGLREGRDCAAAVDRYLMGYTNL